MEAKFRMKVTAVEDGKELKSMVYPSDIIDCGSKEDLLSMLRGFSSIANLMEGGTEYHRPSITTNRRLLEWVYPSLRWFCRIYGVKVPEWLGTNEPFASMSKEEKQKYLGKKPVEVEEWVPEPLSKEREAEESEAEA